MASKLMHKHKFARAANLARSIGIAKATTDTLKSLRHLFPQAVGVSEVVLLDYYGPVAPPNPDTHLSPSLSTIPERAWRLRPYYRRLTKMVGEWSI